MFIHRFTNLRARNNNSPPWQTGGISDLDEIIGLGRIERDSDSVGKTEASDALRKLLHGPKI